MLSHPANGAKMPMIGLGTWTLKGAACADMVAAALAQGYRHIDTAAVYGNEEAVGEGIKRSGIPRDEIFVTTKCWPSELDAGNLAESLAASLDRLQLDYVDLLLIHWPSKTMSPAEMARELASVHAAHYVRAYLGKDLDDLEMPDRMAMTRGLAKHVGVSNFTAAQLREAVAASPVPIACNQCEYHPYLNQSILLEACRETGVAFVAYCPLGRGEAFAEPAIQAAAQAHKCSPAEVTMAWLLQQDVVAIPRTSKVERLASNLNAANVTLTSSEMAAISVLTSKNRRIATTEYAPDWD